MLLQNTQVFECLEASAVFIEALLEAAHILMFPDSLLSCSHLTQPVQ